MWCLSLSWHWGLYLGLWSYCTWVCVDVHGPYYQQRQYKYLRDLGYHWPLESSLYPSTAAAVEELAPPFMGELVSVAWALETSPCPSQGGGPTQLPPKPTSRVLSWPTPTANSFMTCLNAWKDQSWRTVVKGSPWLGETTEYLRGDSLRVQYWWHSRGLEPDQQLIAKKSKAVWAKGYTAWYTRTLSATNMNK